MPKVLPFQATSDRFPWLQVLNLGDGSAEINVRGIIGLSKRYRDWGFESAGTLLEFEEELAEIGEVSNIQLNVFSRGGYVDDAVAMHDILVAHKAKITGRVDGLVGSAATVLLMACDDIEMPEPARWMIHNASGGASGDHRDLSQAAALLRKYTTDIAEMYARRIVINTGKDYATALTEVIEMMNDETWLNGREALEAGLVERLSKPARANASDPANSGLENFRAAASADDSLTQVPALPLVYNVENIPEDVRDLFDGFVDIPKLPEKPSAENSTNSNPSNSMPKPTTPSPTPATSAQPAAAADPAPAQTAEAPQNSDGSENSDTPSDPATPPAAVAEPATPTAQADPAPAPVAEPTANDMASLIAAAVTNAVSAAIKPIQDEISSLQSDQAKMNAGVSNNGWGNNKPVENVADAADDPDEAVVNLNDLTPFQLMSSGRKALTAKIDNNSAA
jgi:ATP-dependent protease ClpP protease subunit